MGLEKVLKGRVVKVFGCIICALADTDQKCRCRYYFDQLIRFMWITQYIVYSSLL